MARPQCGSGGWSWGAALGLGAEGLWGAAAGLAFDPGRGTSILTG